MAPNTHISYVLNGTIQSVQSVIPIQLLIDQPIVPEQPIERASMSVHIALKGTINGQIIINGCKQIFGKIAEEMFGMLLEEEMLQSFTSELGNMIAGNLATVLASEGVEMDITPPSAFEETDNYDNALSLPVRLSTYESFTIILLVQ